jgi:hypothetical protein
MFLESKPCFRSVLHDLVLPVSLLLQKSPTAKQRQVCLDNIFACT